jgi:putative ABC transport system substrate-binding protein
MRRRKFIGRLIGTAVAWPLVARAQESKGVPRVGVLWHAGNAEEEAPYLGPGLKDHGYFDGRTIKLEHRFPNEIPERFEALAAELVALKVDGGGRHSFCPRGATRNNDDTDRVHRRD